MTSPSTFGVNIERSGVFGSSLLATYLVNSSTSLGSSPEHPRFAGLPFPVIKVHICNQHWSVQRDSGTIDIHPARPLLRSLNSQQVFKSLHHSTVNPGKALALPTLVLAAACPWYTISRPANHTQCKANPPLFRRHGVGMSQQPWTR